MTNETQTQHTAHMILCRQFWLVFFISVCLSHTELFIRMGRVLCGVPKNFSEIAPLNSFFFSSKPFRRLKELWRHSDTESFVNLQGFTRIVKSQRERNRVRRERRGNLHISHRLTHYTRSDTHTGTGTTTCNSR